MAGRPGRKPKMTVEEQIEQITSDIETYKSSIKTLEDKKKELLKLKREKDLSTLYEFMQDMGLTVDDIMIIINEKEQKTDKKHLEII